MQKLLKFLIVISISILTFLSLITLITTSPIGVEAKTIWDNFAFRQFLFIVIGALVAWFISRLDIEYFRYRLPQVFFYAISILFLVLVLILPRSIANTHRWFVLGQFTIQPSELLKPFFIILLSGVLTDKNMNMKLKIIFFLIILFTIPILIFIEPDAGTTFLYLFIGLLIFVLWALKYNYFKKAFIAYIVFLFTLTVSFVFKTFYPVVLSLLFSIWFLLKDKKSFIIFGSMLLFSVFLGGITIFAWKNNIIKEYQKERIMPFIQAYQKKGIKGIFNTEGEPNPHVRQAKIAIGSAGIKGKGPWQGTQTRLRFLPEYTTDFIYAAFSEEYGLIGAFILMFLYLTLIVSLISLAFFAKSEFHFLTIIAIAVLLGIEILINIGMNLGVLPTKGIPLPFLSYGGSSTITNFILISLALSGVKDK